MASAETQSPFTRFRRDQIHPAAHHHDDLASFQIHVADLLHRLASPSASLLSIPWLRRLLDCFLLCQEDFRLALSTPTAAAAAASPRLTSDFLDRSVKALDILNAVRDGLDQLRHSRKHLDIVLTALPHDRALNPGRMLRARKALSDLAGNTDPVPRNRSFSRPAAGAHFRSLSWSVPRSWSASRQLQAMASGLNPPRAQEVAATHGLANLFYTMGSVTVFVAWALVAAIPCQDRGMPASFSVPRSYPWAGAMMGLHDRILEEAKKRDRKQSGLLREIQGTDKCVKRLTELIERSEGPLSEEAEGEVRREVEELAEVCEALKEGLDPLESQVREMFHRMVRCRMEGLSPSSSTM